MEQLGNAFSILVIGMVTVFIILSMVVFIGNITIRVTNKFWPGLEPNKNTSNAKTGSNSTVAAIVAAVDIITNGKGKITNIKKL